MDKKVNKDNIDSYYELVNDKIDYYFDRSVSAKSLVNYFSKDYGLNKFIKRENLEDVVGIKKVIRDVVDDRMALDENVKTFEQYSGENEDKFNIYFDITQDVEKVIADHYRVSLGHIDSNRNKIQLKGIKNEQEIFVFTSENIMKIYINIAENIANTFTNNLSFNYKPFDLNLEIDKNVFDMEKLTHSFYSSIRKNEKIIEELIYIETGDEYINVGEVKGIMIFEKK